ncbi:MAG: hypothetical protein ACK559_19505, partial [bacterium]
KKGERGVDKKDLNVAKTTTRTADITSTQCEEDIQYEGIKPTSMADIDISTHTREERKETKKGERGVDKKDLNVLHIDGIQTGVCRGHTPSSTKLVDVGGGVDGLRSSYP